MCTRCTYCPFPLSDPESLPCPVTLSDPLFVQSRSLRSGAIALEAIPQVLTLICSLTDTCPTPHYLSSVWKGFSLPMRLRASQCP